MIRLRLGLLIGFALLLYVTVMVFLALLLVAYIYDWRKGVFEWR